MAAVACRIHIEGQETEPKLFWLSCTLELANFKALVSLLTQVKIDKIRYVDDEGDMVTIETDPELEEAIKLGQNIGELQVSIKPEAPAENLVEVAEPEAEAEPLVVPEEKAPAPEEEEEPAVVHCAYCNVCSGTITGVRYKCANCPDYDLCETCEARHFVTPLHEPNHLFLKIRRPICPYHRSMLPNYYVPPAPKVGKKFVTKNSRISALESKVEVMAKQLESLTAPQVNKQAEALQRAEEKKRQAEEKRRVQEEKRREKEERKEQLKKMKEERERRKRELQLKKKQEREAANAAFAAAQAHAQVHARAVAEAHAQAVAQAQAQVEVKVEVTETDEEPEVVPVQTSECNTFQVQIQPDLPVTVRVVEAPVDQSFEISAAEVEEFVKVQEGEEGFEHELAMLAEMGFTEISKLLPLLVEHSGDIEAVLAILLA